MDATNVSIEGEVWKDVVGYEGLYRVSNKGRVLSIGEGVPQIVRQYSVGKGYRSVYLRMKDNSGAHRVHRLVAFAFIPTIEGKTCVNHINAVRDDNNLENLEWVTYKENTAHAQKLGNIKTAAPVYVQVKPLSHKRLLDESQVKRIREMLAVGTQSQRSIARHFGIGHSTVRDIASGKTYVSFDPGYRAKPKRDRSREKYKPRPKKHTAN